MKIHLHLLISIVEINELNNNKYYDNNATSEIQNLDSRTEIDSHANMPVVGHNCYILSDSDTFAEVNAFSPDYKTKKILIVDASVL